MSYSQRRRQKTGSEEMPTLEQVVARFRFESFGASEYQSFCETLRQWFLKALSKAKTSDFDLHAFIQTRSSKKVFLARGPSKKSSKFKQRQIERHEQQSAELIGGKKQPNSGRPNCRGMKGDAISDCYLVDAKQTDKNSIGVKIDWITKLCQQAWPLGREPIFHLRYNSMRNQFPNDWVMLTADEFKRLRDAANGKSND